MDTKSFYKGTKESSAEGGGGGSSKPGSVCHNIYFMLEFMIIFFIQACTRSRETVEECQGKKAVCLGFTFCTVVLLSCAGTCCLIFSVCWSQSLSGRSFRGSRWHLTLQTAVTRYKNLSLAHFLPLHHFYYNFYLQNVAVFAFESEDIGKEGQRRYLVTTYYVFGREYL